MPWPRTALGAVTTIDRQGIAPESIKEGVLYVGLENIQRGGRITGVTRTVNGQLASTKFFFDTRHVLFGKLRPNLAKIARPDFEGICSTDILPLRPGPSLDRNYLAHYLALPKIVRLATSRAAGVNLPRLSPTELLEFVMPLPPLNEQRRIADILDRADALRAKRREALAHLPELTQSIFLEMFGDPNVKHTQLPVQTIGQMLDSAQYGTSAKAGSTGRYPILRMGNLTVDGKIDLRDLKYIDVNAKDESRYLVYQGDVLFNRTNSAELVGKTAIYRLPIPVAYAGYLVRLRVNSSNHPEYLSAFLNSGYGKRVLRGMAKSIVGMANINAREVQQITIGIPNLAEQRVFAERVLAVERKRETYLESAAEFDALFASLQQRAFAGEL